MILAESSAEGTTSKRGIIFEEAAALTVSVTIIRLRSPSSVSLLKRCAAGGEKMAWANVYFFGAQGSQGFDEAFHGSGSVDHIIYDP